MEDWKLLNYLNEKADPGEVAAVERWLAGDPANKEQLEQLRELWSHADAFGELESVDIQKDWRQVRDRMGFEQEPGSDEDNISGDRINSGNKFGPFNVHFYPLLKIAALIVVILIPAIMLERKFNYLGSPESAWISESTSELPKKLFLQDGSSVQLNWYSEISYPAEFDLGKREVRLEGEAFFEVISSEEKPFLIHTGPELVVEVIGTSFNIHSRKDKVVVHVISGMVSLYETGKEKDILLLAAGEEGHFGSRGLYKPDAANPNNTSWLTEKLVFKNTPLGDVVSDISRYTGRKIIMRGEGMEAEVLTATYENQELEDILEEIKLILTIEYSIIDDTIVFHPTGE